ncbi:MAG: GGDEF domain-containing protein [Pseudomonadales bacterium]|nr:GGDEF domain-containing protein [Pseudomonadales bacterium]
MNIALPYIMKLRSTLIVSGMLLLYTLLCWFALKNGLLIAEGPSALVFLSVWALGFVSVPLAIVMDFSRRYRELKATLQRLQKLALRDDLTGVNNRRHLMNYLKRQKASVDRGGATFSICYADLDHFKQMNDRYGHVAGDRVLKAFADLATATVRDVDFVARIGGEEFVLVLANASARDSYPVAERLRTRMAELLITTENPEYRVTVSLGIAQYCNEEHIDELLHRADSALYRAKKVRNCTEVAPSVRMVEPFNRLSVGS